MLRCAAAKIDGGHGMLTDFSRTLSLLRKEKGISQRVVAEKLGISQALLSHYENGIREPGLDFVVRACDYYTISADYLLGRTMSRDGTAIYAEQLHDGAGEKENNLRSVSVLALLNKKLLINTCSIIFDLLGKTGRKEAITQASNFISTAMYKVFRQIYMNAGTKPDEFFSVPSTAFSDASDADMKVSEMRFKSALRGHGPLFKDANDAQRATEISNDTLARDYPQLFQSLLSVLHATGERLSRQL